MPVYLPPISRRQFLKRSAVAGAAVALSGADSLFARSSATKRVNPDSWALLADTHLAGDRSRNARGINMTDHFTAVSKDLLSLPERPAGVFIIGDCAYNSGEKNDYAVVADLLDPIRKGPLPVHLTLGNHDNRERFWEAFKDEKAAKRPLADKQVALLRTPRVNWFMLDSLEETLSTPGLLGTEQLDWLGKALDANPGKPALVLLHHNPGLLGGQIGLKDTGPLLDVIRPRKQVKAYIYGHTHNWEIAQDESGIHFVNLPPVAYVFEEGKPAGWAHALVDKQGMVLELRCVDQTHKNHGQKVNLRWRT